MNYPTLLPALKSCAGVIQNDLSDFFKEKKEEARLVDETLLQLTTILEEQVLRGGKRVRGFLVVVGSSLAKGSGDQDSTAANLVRVSSAVELYHSYLCALDDIADRDEMRHGGPTLEVVFRTLYPEISPQAQTHFYRTLAEFTSALLGTYATDALRSAELKDSKLNKILKLINQVSISQPMAGWMIHYKQNQEDIQTVSEDRFIKGLELVTAQYTFTSPLLIGLAQAGHPTEHDPVADLLHAYGKAAGTAFQMRDDEIGMFGDPAVTGKPIGNDLREGKKTLLLQHAWKHGSSEDKTVISSAINTDFSRETYEEIVKIMKKTGAIENSELKKQQFAAKALSILDELETMDLDAKQIQILRELTQYTIERDH